MNHKEKDPSRWIVWFLFAFMFILAVTGAVVGVLVPKMQEDYQLTYDRIGYLSSIQNVGGFVTVLVGGLLADRFDKLRLIGVCALIYTVCLLFSGMIPPYAVLLLLFFVIGAMSNMESVLVSAYISQKYQEKAFSYLNISHGFFGAGSLIGPTYATILFGLNLKWTRLYQTLAVTCGLILVLYVILQWKLRTQSDRTTEREGILESAQDVTLVQGMTPVQGMQQESAQEAMPVQNMKSSQDATPVQNRNPKEAKKESGGYRSLLTHAGVISLCAACCVYMGQQTALSTWITSYSLEAATKSTTLAGLVTSIYWLGITLGRFLQSLINEKADSVKMTLLGCTVGSVLLAIALVSGNIWVILVLVCANGICTGAAYPNMIGAMGKAAPGLTGAGTSALCITGTLGGIFFPWITAKVIGLSYLGGMMICPAAQLITAALLGICILRTNAKN